MHKAYLSLGSNRDGVANLRSGLAALRARFGDVVHSPVYRTAAVGFEGDDFLNSAAIIETGLEPQALNEWLHALEDAHGRDRSGPRYGDRTLDIDIVLFDDLMCEGAGNLRIPAPGTEACLRAEAAGRHRTGRARPGRWPHPRRVVGGTP